MVLDGRWKLVHFEGGFRPMLFDLETDPQELVDLGTAPEHAEVRARLHEAIFAWSRRHHNRITMPAERVERMTGGEPPGIIIGVWDEEDYARTFGQAFSDRP